MERGGVEVEVQWTPTTAQRHQPPRFSVPPAVRYITYFRKKFPTASTTTSVISARLRQQKYSTHSLLLPANTHLQVRLARRNSLLLQAIRSCRHSRDATTPRLKCRWNQHGLVHQPALDAIRPLFVFPCTSSSPLPVISPETKHFDAMCPPLIAPCPRSNPHNRNGQTTSRSLRGC